LDIIKQAITDWLRQILVGGIISNLTGLFDTVNQRVGEISGQVGTTPQAWNGSIYSMIRNLSDTVIMPIAGVILAFVMTIELIQLITEKNNILRPGNREEVSIMQLKAVPFRRLLCYACTSYRTRCKGGFLCHDPEIKS
jgi:hypothetical protein